jgi:RNA polymerase sigma factor (sigma-70 family)
MEVIQVHPDRGRLTHERSAVTDAFLETHRDALVGLAYVLTGSREAAQDAVHDVVERILARDLSKVRDLNAYARRAVTNACASRGRQLGGRQKRLAELRSEWQRTLSTQPDPFHRIELMSALQALSTRQRAAIVLKYYLDLPDDDIANTLGCAPATVRSLLSRGLRRLRSELSDERGAS